MHPILCECLNHSHFSRRTNTSNLIYASENWFLFPLIKTNVYVCIRPHLDQHTSLSKRARIGRVRVAVVLAKVFGNTVSSQLSNNVWDVSIWAEMLESLMGTTYWTKSKITHEGNHIRSRLLLGPVIIYIFKNVQLPTIIQGNSYLGCWVARLCWWPDVLDTRLGAERFPAAPSHREAGAGYPPPIPDPPCVDCGQKRRPSSLWWHSEEPCVSFLEPNPSLTFTTPIINTTCNVKLLMRVMLKRQFKYKTF